MAGIAYRYMCLIGLREQYHSSVLRARGAHVPSCPTWSGSCVSRVPEPGIAIGNEPVHVQWLGVMILQQTLRE